MTKPIPDWVFKISEIELTQRDLDSLPEYSCSLPDSYKRPISEGGRPWKRDLNFYGLFAEPEKKIWIYCEYIPDQNPELLGILSKRVVIKTQ